MQISSIASTIVGIIVVFYLVSSLYSPLEGSAIALQNSLNASTLTNVSSLATLPGVAVLIFIIALIFGIVFVAVRFLGGESGG